MLLPAWLGSSGVPYAGKVWKISMQEGTVQAQGPAGGGRDSLRRGFTVRVRFWPFSKNWGKHKIRVAQGMEGTQLTAVKYMSAGHAGGNENRGDEQARVVVAE